MIKAKLKMCAGCDLPKYIWKSHGKEKVLNLFCNVEEIQYI